MSSPKPSAFTQLRARTEAGFARWGAFCHDHPWWIIAAISAALVFFSSYFSQMEVDTSNESYLRETDPARVAYDAFQREFGKDERIVVLVESDGDIINESFLRRLESLHQALENTYQVDKVDSLINARLTLGRDDQLIVQDLLEDWPQDAAGFQLLRERILANPLYRQQFVSGDLSRAALIVTPDTYTASHSGADNDTALEDFDFSAGFDDVDTLLEASPAPAGDDAAHFITDQEIYGLLDAIKALKPSFAAEDFRISLAGSPYVMHQLTFILGRDMFLFSGVGVLLIAALLFAVFRRWIIVVLPVMVSALSVYLTFALMCFFGMVITTSVQILPSLLLAVGVGNAVHIFTVFFQAQDRGESKREALRYALGHSGLAVMMTGLTTAGGLASFVTANLKPVADIGIVAPMGILCALLFSLTLLPALIAVTPFRPRPLREDDDSPLQRFLAGCARVSTTYPLRVIGLWFALIAISLLLVSRIQPSHFPLDWFPVGSEVREATKTLDSQFKGATYTEILIDSGQDYGLHEPELLQAVDRAVTFLKELRIGQVQAGHTVSLLDINKELHQALNGNDPAFYRIPDDRALIAQELLLFENSGSDDLEDFVDTNFRKMRITVKMPFVDGIEYGAYLPAMRAGFDEIIGDRAEVTYTGVILLLAGSVDALIGDTIRAYLLAFLIISPLMMLLVGSVRIGLLSMIPNLAPIVITLALMSLLGIPLDAFTLLVGSIALGLAVDDTIHFMHNYQRYFSQSGDAALAVRQTLRTTGKALLITSVVLSGAFFVNMLGTMYNLQHFGLLTGFCIIVAFLADVLLAPALMTVLAAWKSRSLKEAYA